jgi:hypothetical protein
VRGHSGRGHRVDRSICVKELRISIFSPFCMQLRRLCECQKVGECRGFGNAVANILPQKVLSLHFQIKTGIVTLWGRFD